MTRIAVPSICQQACVALSHTVVQSLVNSFGQATMAGYEAASKIHNFAYMSFNTIGTALSSFVAQNYGAGQTRRIREGYKVSSLICLAVTACVILVMQLFAGPLIGLFVDKGEADYAEVMRVGTLYLRIISPDYLMICFVITSGGLLRGGCLFGRADVAERLGLLVSVLLLLDVEGIVFASLLEHREFVGVKHVIHTLSHSSSLFP